VDAQSEFPPWGKVRFCEIDLWLRALTYRGLHDLLEIHHQQFGFGHFFDGVAQPLAAESGVFDPAVGHVVDAERGHISGNQPTDFQFFVGIEDQLGVAR
jgi:hypothetical protein